MSTWLLLTITGLDLTALMDFIDLTGIPYPALPEFVIVVFALNDCWTSIVPWLSRGTLSSRLLPLPTLERMIAPTALVNVPLTSMRASLPPPLIDVRSIRPLLVKACAMVT